MNKERDEHANDINTFFNMPITKNVLNGSLRYRWSKNQSKQATSNSNQITFKYNNHMNKTCAHMRNARLIREVRGDPLHAELRPLKITF